MNKRIKQLILLTGDISILYLSLYLTLMLRYWGNPSPEVWEKHITPFGIIFIFWIVIFYIFNLYYLHFTVTNPHFLKSLGRSVFISFITSILFFYVYTDKEIAPKTTLLIFAVVFFEVFLIWRRIYSFFLESYTYRKNIAIVGRNDLVGDLIDEIDARPHLAYNISFIVDIIKGDKKEIKGVPIYNSIQNLPELIKKKNINYIVLTSNPENSNELRSALFKCLPYKINFINLVNFYEQISDKIPVNVINKMWFLENLNERSKKEFDTFKRIYDIILSGLILIITLPFWVIIALAIKIESKGPVFFTQVRVGKNNKEFKIIKFRTMKTVDNNHTPTTNNDVRITKIGNFMRQTRLDEIPQVLNILKGDMSLIGPRPERPEFTKELEKGIPFYNERHLVKPGLSGWAQINYDYGGTDIHGTFTKIQYDLYYIKNRSIYLDLSIILKTVRTVFARAGR